MSIIITGLEMPTERESFNLTIKYNGTVLDTETGLQVAEAHELPPHGRLGDLDALHKLFLEKGKEFKGIGGAMVAAAAWCIANAPTIIPADHEEEEMK